jgi:hypothetical protein
MFPERSAAVLKNALSVIDEQQKRARRRPIFELAMVRTHRSGSARRHVHAEVAAAGCVCAPDRGSQVPAYSIQPRNVSRDSRTSWRSPSFSAASVRPRVRVVLPDRLDGMITNDIRQAVVRKSTTPPVRNSSRTAIAVSLQQPMGLAQGEPHQIGRRRARQPTAIEPRQYINAIQLSLAHQHYKSDPQPPNLTTRRQRTNIQLCSVLTF